MKSFLTYSTILWTKRSINLVYSDYIFLNVKRNFLVQDETFCIYFCTPLWFDFIQLVTDKPKDLIAQNEIASWKLDIFYRRRNRNVNAAKSFRSLLCRLFFVHLLLSCAFSKVQVFWEVHKIVANLAIFFILLCSVKL